MGMARKMMSVSTVGLVSYRSPREKQADAAKQTSRTEAKLAKAEAKLAKEQAKLLKQQRKAS